MIKQKIDAGRPPSSPDAFGALYSPLAEPLARCAVRLIGDVDQARDLVHSIFADLWEHRREADGFPPEPAYLHRAVKNRSIDFSRRERRERRVIRQVSRGPQRQRNDNASLEAYGNFSTGSLRHRVVVGADWFREDYLYRNELAFADTVALQNPVFPGEPMLTPFGFAFSSLSGASSSAGYVQDPIDVTPRIRGLLGGRLGRLRQFVDNYADGPRVRTPDSPPTQLKSRFSPGIGLVFEATDATTYYGNAISSFRPNCGIFNFPGTGSVVRNNNPFPARVAQQYEIGVKQSLLDRLVFAIVAAYSIARTNAGGTARGLTFGGGAQYTGAVPSRLQFDASDTGAFLLPGATVLDAMAAYERGGCRVGLNLKNIANQTTWVGDGLHAFMAGRPFDVVLSLGTRF